jgi:hypothetical protein
MSWKRRVWFLTRTLRPLRLRGPASHLSTALGRFHRRKKESVQEGITKAHFLLLLRLWEVLFLNGHTFVSSSRDGNLTMFCLPKISIVLVLLKANMRVGCDCSCVRYKVSNCVRSWAKISVWKDFYQICCGNLFEHDNEFWIPVHIRLSVWKYVFQYLCYELFCTLILSHAKMLRCNLALYHLYHCLSIGVSIC